MIVCNKVVSLRNVVAFLQLSAASAADSKWILGLFFPHIKPHLSVPNTFSFRPCGRYKRYSKF